MESIWKKVDVENAKSGYDIRLSGRDESGEDSLSGYCPGRDLNRIYLGYSIKSITVDLSYSLEYWKYINEVKNIPFSFAPRSEDM